VVYGLEITETPFLKRGGVFLHPPLAGAAYGLNREENLIFSGGGNEISFSFSFTFYHWLSSVIDSKKFLSGAAKLRDEKVGNRD
jgi:hypothetical protein